MENNIPVSTVSSRKTQEEILEALRSQYSEEVIQIVMNQTLMDDSFFSKCMENNIPAAELILRIILGMDDLTVVELNIQQEIINAIPGGRSIRMDALAKDATGKHFNIEVQNVMKKADPTRARFYSAMMDTLMLKSGQDFDEIRDSYMIFITDGDYFGRNQPLYPIHRYLDDDGSPFNDGNHIIYVNGKNKDTGTPLGRLIHDLKCTDPDRFYHDELRRTVSHFKRTQEGAKTMCRTIDEYAEKYAKNYAKAYGQECEARGISIGEARGISIGEARGISIGEARAAARYQAQIEELKSQLAQAAKYAGA